MGLTATYNPTHGHAVLYGGTDTANQRWNTWINATLLFPSKKEYPTHVLLSEIAVVHKPGSETNKIANPPLVNHASAWFRDQASHKIILVGGQTKALGDWDQNGNNKLWTFSYDTATSAPTTIEHKTISDDNPSGRKTHTLTSLNDNQNLMLYGGSPTDDQVYIMGSEYTWNVLPVIFSTSNGEEQTSESLGLIRSGHSASVVQENFIIIFGGQKNSETIYNDVVVLEMIIPSDSDESTEKDVEKKGANGGGRRLPTESPAVSPADSSPSDSPASSPPPANSPDDSLATSGGDDVPSSPEIDADSKSTPTSSHIHGIWRRLNVTGMTPSRRHGHTSELFNKRYLCVFGGASGTSSEDLHELSILDLYGLNITWQSSSPPSIWSRSFQWTFPVDIGTSPSTRRGAASYLVTSSLAIVVGGVKPGESSKNSDMYALSATTETMICGHGCRIRSSLDGTSTYGNCEERTKNAATGEGTTLVGNERFVDRAAALAKINTLCSGQCFCTTTDIWDDVDCQKGKGWSQESKSCVACAAGRRSDETSNNCTACKVGAVAPDAMASQCTTCEAGTFHNIGLDVGRRWMDGLVLFFYM